MHHPFTAPQSDDPAALRAAPAAALAKAYDMVLNGSEIGGGSVRIHRQEMQSTVFELLGIAAAEAQQKFGFLLDALKFGAPPHGGIAFGLDRLAMLMAGADSIREVIAFPKTQTAADPLTDAPTEVERDAAARAAHPGAGAAALTHGARRLRARPVDARGRVAASCAAAWPTSFAPHPARVPLLGGGHHDERHRGAPRELRAAAATRASCTSSVTAWADWLSTAFSSASLHSRPGAWCSSVRRAWRAARRKAPDVSPPSPISWATPWPRNCCSRARATGRSARAFGIVAGTQPLGVGQLLAQFDEAERRHRRGERDPHAGRHRPHRAAGEPPGDAGVGARGA